jgi:hypothetical protein
MQGRIGDDKETTREQDNMSARHKNQQEDKKNIQHEDKT